VGVDSYAARQRRRRLRAGLGGTFLRLALRPVGHPTAGAFNGLPFCFDTVGRFWEKGMDSAKKTITLPKLMIHRIKLSLVWIVLITSALIASHGHAQGTAFTYQGRLNLNGSPANGLYDFTFNLSSNPQGTIITAATGTLGVPVTNGLFTAVIDFGPNQFVGASNWLQIGVRTNLVGNYTNLSPLTLITPTPNAIFANTASNLIGSFSAAKLTGTIPQAQLPASVVTNNQTGVTLSNPTINGVLNLTPSEIVNGANPVLYSDTNNTVFGLQAFASNRNGIGNIAIGYQALYTGAASSNNTAVGYQALYSTVTNFNTAIGYQALYSNTVAEFNTAVGHDALRNNSTNGFYNTAVGYQALENNNAYFNTAVGIEALQLNTIGYRNTALGVGTLQQNTIGGDNTALGSSALAESQGGFYNVAVGDTALQSLGNGMNNIAIGESAGGDFYSTESNNIDIGNAGVTGENNITRIGTPGVQTNAVIAGTIYGDGGGLTNLVNVPTAGNYLFSYDTTTQAAGVVNTFLNITFGVNSHISGWAHTASTATFTCNQAGFYMVQYTGEAGESTSTSLTLSMRLEDNGTEIPGSQAAVAINSTALAATCSKSVLVSLNTGDVLELQFAASATGGELVPPASGSGATKPSVSITAVRIQ
jgi:hypothetical protein